MMAAHPMGAVPHGHISQGTAATKMSTPGQALQKDVVVMPWGSAGPAAVGVQSVFLTPSLSCFQPHVALSLPYPPSLGPEEVGRVAETWRNPEHPEPRVRVTGWGELKRP